MRFGLPSRQTNKKGPPLRSWLKILLTKPIISCVKRRRKRTSRLVSSKIVHYCKLFITECYEYECVFLFQWPRALEAEGALNKVRE